MSNETKRWNKGVRQAILAGLAVAWVPVAIPGAALAQGEFALKRITLSSGGVGYFDYETSVDGTTERTLSVRLDHVDDVLKSIIIRDPRANSTSIRLAGREPLKQVFRSLPIDRNALRSPALLLKALTGSVIRVAGTQNIEGRIVAVVPEKTRLPDGLGETLRHRVTVLTSTGLRHFVLEDTESVQFADGKIVAAIAKGLSAIEENRAQDKRVFHIRLSGEGRRTVSAGYVVPVPLWKTTYRMTLPAAGSKGTGKVLLEGWAIIENMTTEDWEGVELTLVSGNPVTFRQSLYSAYYVDRPEIPVEVTGRILPRADKGAVAQKAKVASRADRDTGSRTRRRSAPRSYAPGGAGIAGGGIASAMSRVSNALEAPRPPPPSYKKQLAAKSRDAATQVVFQLPLPVSVKTGHSMVVQFLSRELPADRIALYQRDTHPRHPLASVRIRNDGKTGLPPGALTLYERSPNGTLTYVGDAQLNTLPAGEQRIVSYALDNKTTIDREYKSRQSILKGKISRGVLELTRLSERTTTYRIKVSAKEGRQVVIEHPRRSGWKLAKPKKDDTALAPRHYRIGQRIAKASQEDLTVVLQKLHTQTYQLATLRRSTLVSYSKTGGIDPKMRDVFVQLARMMRGIEDGKSRLKRLEKDRKRWTADQKRIRFNLSSVPRNSDLHRRYLKRLSDREAKIEKIMDQTDAQQTALEKSRIALRDHIQKLKL